MRTDDKDEEEGIDGQFDYFGAMCLPYTKSVATETLFDLSSMPAPAAPVALCDENGNPTGGAAAAAAAANASQGGGAAPAAQAGPDPQMMQLVQALQSGAMQPNCDVIGMSAPPTKTFDPEEMGIAKIAKLGVPPCDSMAY